MALGPEVNFSGILHKDTAYESTPALSILKKDAPANRKAVSDYLSHWTKEVKNVKDVRDVKDIEKPDAKEQAPSQSMVNNYYDISTDLFEFGWGTSFHDCRFLPGEPWAQAIARYQHYLASMLQVLPGMKILDVGCGVGGPARQICAFTECHVTGINNHFYQLQRARKLTKDAGLSHMLNYIKGDFMDMPFEDNSFDAAYAIEATLHASSLARVYSEAYRVLKPGGIFALYEWVTTSHFDPTNETHRAIKHRIEIGDSIPQLVTHAEAIAAMRTAGFTIIRADDVADNDDRIPWWQPLDPKWKDTASWLDAAKFLLSGKRGRGVTLGLLRWLEYFGLAPSGMRAAAETIECAAVGMEEGGKAKIFTPMFLMVGRK